MSIQGQILNMQYQTVDEILADSARIETELTTLRAKLAAANEKAAENYKCFCEMQAERDVQIERAAKERFSLREQLAARDAEVARLREALIISKFGLVIAMEYMTDAEETLAMIMVKSAHDQCGDALKGETE